MPWYICLIKLCSCFSVCLCYWFLWFVATYAGMISLLFWAVNLNDLCESNHGLGEDHDGCFRNSGTPKSSILIGFSIIKPSILGTPIFGNTPITSSKKGLIRPRCFGMCHDISSTHEISRGSGIHRSCFGSRICSSNLLYITLVNKTVQYYFY